MRYFWRKDSNREVPMVSPESNSLLDQSPTQQGSLVFPTKLDEVVRGAHTGVPRHLPGEKANQDEVRYFLYQVLTLKEHNIALAHPQWVLETCMCWTGDGRKLRLLGLDAFQQLCPLASGYASIDWRVKGSKFKQQNMPSCEVRHAIGDLVRRVVVELKKKETGNRGPGWQVSGIRQDSAKALPGVGRMHGPPPQLGHKFSTPSFAAAAGFPLVYNSKNQPLPLLPQIKASGMEQTTISMQPQTRGSCSQYGVSTAGTAQTMLRGGGSAQVTSKKGFCSTDASPIFPPSSTSSWQCQTERTSSRLSKSTAKTSTPSSNSEINFWTPGYDQPCSIMPSVASVVDSAFNSPETHRVPSERQSTVTPNHYKACVSTQATQVSDRSYNPVHDLAYLRSGPSASTPVSCTPSETSLSPSDSVTQKLIVQRDHFMPTCMTRPTPCGHPAFYPTIRSDAFSLSSMQSHLTETPHACPAFVPTTQGHGISLMGIAPPPTRSHSISLHPINHHKVDAHGSGSTDSIGCSWMSARVRSLRVEADTGRGLDRCRSEGRLDRHFNKFSKDVQSHKELLCPSIRSQNSRPGQPRLTIYETIEGRQKLGKRQAFSQSTADTLQRRGLTVYETIEEKEILGGKPQRGVDTSVENNWTSYF